MKLAIAVFLFVLTTSSYANTLDCRWLKTSNLAEGFYKPAQLKVAISENEVQILNDTFTSRRYEPCWVGGHSSCYFGFDYNKEEPWKIHELSHTPESTSLTMTSNWYWQSEITFYFENSLNSLSSGDMVVAEVHGDDGDGVWFEKHKFACTKE
ncbi:MAG: hypothetical protein AAF202_12685 [Pseudomonadota bacterium]